MLTLLIKQLTRLGHRHPDERILSSARTAAMSARHSPMLLLSARATNKHLQRLHRRARPDRLRAMLLIAAAWSVHRLMRMHHLPFIDIGVGRWFVMVEEAQALGKQGRVVRRAGVLLGVLHGAVVFAVIGIVAVGGGLISSAIAALLGFLAVSAPLMMSVAALAVAVSAAWPAFAVAVGATLVDVTVSTTFVTITTATTFITVAPSAALIVISTPVTSLLAASTVLVVVGHDLLLMQNCRGKGFFRNKVGLYVVLGWVVDDDLWRGIENRECESEV